MFGFYRICCAVPQLRIADVKYNAAEIESLYKEACENGAGAVLFPELALTSASCGDLFYQYDLLENVRFEAQRLIEASGGAVMIFGAPAVYNNSLYNCAFVAQNGRLLGIVPKGGCDRKSVFADGRDICGSGTVKWNGREVAFNSDVIFSDDKFSFGVVIGEDLSGMLPQSAFLNREGACVVFDLSAVRELPGSWDKRLNSMIDFSERCSCAYIYASAGAGESVTDCVYAGRSAIVEAGTLLNENRPFDVQSNLIYDEIDVEKLRNLKLKQNISNDIITMQNVECEEIAEADELKYRYIESQVFVPENPQELEEVLQIQTYALADRIKRINSKTMVLGISGGLDSTLALLVCHNVCKKLNRPFSDIIAFTLPGFGTTGRTYNNAVALAKELGVTLKEVNIKEAALQHFKDIGHDVNDIDVTYENTQARERTQILMDYANKSGGIVIGTGDLSELALGWCTYNGDHMSMYGLNSSVPKTQIRPLISHYAENCSEKIQAILQDIIDTPVSPELLPPSKTGEIAQKTEDILGPYELHDFFLYHFITAGASVEKMQFMAERAFAGVYTADEISGTLKMFVRRFFTQQFKRNAVPDGVQANLISLSPRTSWLMPSEANSASFMIDAEGRK
ncbi:MAG: NAD(+) synthase [Lentisphaeria bacterium]|nr:NAD(+) synthase [Lentisphaeria bacterium]